MAQGGFLGGNELLSKFAALFGERRELCEQSPIRADQVKAGKENGNQSRRQKQIYLALNAVINLPNTQRSLLFALIVLYKQAGHGRAQRLLPRSQRDPNLGPGFRLVGIMRQCKGSIHRIPELRDRILQILLLLGSAIDRRNLLLAP